MRALLAVALLSSGCYWSSPPSTPHRSVRVDLATTPPFETPSPAPLTSKRVIVLGRFDTSAPNPIGGLYDRKDYSVAPLIRTYFFKDGAVEVFEHVSDALRASGLNVMKDYAGHAEPALLEPPLREKQPILVTATVLALQHDQIREKGEDGRVGEWEAARLELAVRVADANGAVRLDKKFLVEGRAPWSNDSELLKTLGWSMAAKLSRDVEFVRAVEAGAQ